MTEPTNPESTFTCECCGGTVKRNDESSDKDTQQQAIDNGFEGLPLAYVCDMCYTMLMAARRRSLH